MAKVTRIDDRWLCQPGKVGLGRTVARVMVRVLGLGRNKACRGGTVRGRARTTMAVAIVLGMLAGGCQDGGARQQEPVRAGRRAHHRRGYAAGRLEQRRRPDVESAAAAAHYRVGSAAPVRLRGVLA